MYTINYILVIASKQLRLNNYISLIVFNWLPHYSETAHVTTYANPDPEANPKSNSGPINQTLTLAITVFQVLYLLLIMQGLQFCT